MKNLDARIPNLKLISHGSGDNQIKFIEGFIKLPVWSGFQHRQGFYNSENSLYSSGGTVKLHLGGDMVIDNPEILDEHVNAYNYVVRHQLEIQNTILKSLMLIYPAIQQQYDYDEKERQQFMPDVQRIEQFKTLIGLSTLHLLNVSKDNVAYVGYEFGCRWDDEHGFGVMTHKDRVIKIGNADSSFLTWIAKQDIEEQKKSNGGY